MSLLSVIIPVYNEENNLEPLLKRFTEAPCPIEREFIVIDDKSTDASLAVLRSLQAQKDFKLIAQAYNQGKGAAVIRGIQEARGDLIVIQDADWEYDPSDIPALIQPILDDKADVVYGSRFRQTSPQIHRTYHYFVNRTLTLLSNLCSGIYLSDMETCYKVFRADLLQAMRLRSQRFGIEVEMTAYTAKTRARIYELPISYHPRTRLEGKKINWKDGIAALYHLIHFNFGTSVPEAFQGLPERYKPGKSRDFLKEKNE
jgi:glycosyltransferase involved in cell wall biosynthesis